MSNEIWNGTDPLQASECGADTERRKHYQEPNARIWTPMAEVIADLDLEIQRQRELLMVLIRQRSWLMVEDIKQRRQLNYSAVRPNYESLEQ